MKKSSRVLVSVLAPGLAGCDGDIRHFRENPLGMVTSAGNLDKGCRG